MRGTVTGQEALFYSLNLEEQIEPDHPLRKIKGLADEALKRLSPAFSRMYESSGRASIPPERLLKAMILIALYSVRSERQFCEQLRFNLLWRWFLDMSLDEGAWDASTFSRNRNRLLKHDVSRRFFEETVEVAKDRELLSERHFSVDGTLIEAWASMKSFQPKNRKTREDRKDKDDDSDPGNPSVNFHGEKRSNATHASTTDPESRLMRKGGITTAKLSFTGNFLMENRNGLLVDVRIDEANGTAERAGALKMLERVRTRRRGKLAAIRSLGADKGYDAGEFIAAVRRQAIRTHIPRVTGRKPLAGVDGRTTRTIGYRLSQRIRKRIEEAIGWVKTVGGLRRTRFKGLRRTEEWALMVGATFNLLRIPRIEALRALA